MENIPVCNITNEVATNFNVFGRVSLFKGGGGELPMMSLVSRWHRFPAPNCSLGDPNPGPSPPTFCVFACQEQNSSSCAYLKNTVCVRLSFVQKTAYESGQVGRKCIKIHAVVSKSPYWLIWSIGNNTSRARGTYRNIYRNLVDPTIDPVHFIL